MLIRPERVEDYAAIGAVHARAFGNRAPEASIVALLRQRRAFDPALSLVAERDGRVVGHALFSPYRMRLLDRTIRAVNLAPLAVDPSAQGQGIGGALIAEGHRIAQARGYSVGILLGHPTYYPRFGYQTHAFGTARLACAAVAVASVATNRGTVKLEARGPVEADVPALLRLWRHEEGRVDMALEPGPDLLDWLSPHPGIRAVVYTHAGEVVGYARYRAEQPYRPEVFCARYARTARAMVAALAATFDGGATGATGAAEMTLPLHPYSASARALGALGQAECEASAAAMACALDRGGPLDDYLARVRAGGRLVGRVIWPVAFDLA